MLAATIKPIRVWQNRTAVVSRYSIRRKCNCGDGCASAEVFSRAAKVSLRRRRRWQLTALVQQLVRWRINASHQHRPPGRIHPHLHCQVNWSIHWSVNIALSIDQLFSWWRNIESYSATVETTTSRMHYAGAQTRLKSWGGPKFGSQHRGACAPRSGQRPGWVLGAGGSRPSPAVKVRGYYPRKFWKTQMLNPAFWWLLAV